MMAADVHVAASQIVFSFGAIAFAGLALMWRRHRLQPGWPEPSAFYPLLFSVISGWFLLNLATPGFLVLMAAACVFPPLVHRLMRGRRGLWVTSAVSAGLAGAALSIRFGVAPESAVGPLAAAYTVLLAVTMLVGGGAGGAKGWWLAAGAIATVGVALWWRTGWLTLAMRSLPLAFLFVQSYERRRFLFLDLFVKWAAQYAVALGAALLVAVYVVPRMNGLMLAVVLLALVYVAPEAARRVGEWLDRRVLRRPMAALEAQALFRRRIQASTTEPALVEQAEAACGEIFGTRARVVLKEGRPKGAAAVAEVAHGGHRQGWIALDEREDKRPLFSEDHRLLAALADAFASALEARRTEIRLLQSQINPHFLFNSLNTIASLIPDDAAKAESMVLRLSGLLRHALKRSRSEWAALRAEFDFVRDCVELERARFGEVEAVIDLPVELEETKVPSMCLQILVENAFKHGLSKAPGRKRLEVSASRGGQGVRLRVADNGPGLGGDGTGAGRGLEIVRALLERHYGATARLALDRDEEAGLTVATMEVPG